MVHCLQLLLVINSLLLQIQSFTSLLNIVLQETIKLLPLEAPNVYRE
ncbi:hypothetical protein GLYMA_03G075551v4 [Glycine max]|nr:hypothetical protein GLYMA_03G075551v4 [Glycine max]KAH1069004.1 hypothetical protein GYH30_006543 [Glycine max]